MSEAIDHFLSTAKVDSDAIDVVEVKFKTKSGLGYNLRNSQTSKSYYYHMKPEQVLNVGEKYLITFQKSKRCLDRMDVVQAIKVTSLTAFMKLAWKEEGLKTLLVNDFFESSIFNTWIYEKLVSEIPKSAELLNAFFGPLPPKLAHSLSDKVPLQSLPTCIEYLGTQLTITSYLIEKGLPENQQEEADIVAFCRQQKLLSCLYLINLLKGKVTAKSFDARLSNIVISDVFALKSKGPTIFIQSLISGNKDCFKVFCNLAYEHSKLKSMVKTKLVRAPQDYQLLDSYLAGFSADIQVMLLKNIPIKQLVADIPDTAEKLDSYLRALPKVLIKLIVNDIPLHLLPSCIDYCGSPSTIISFLIEEGISTEPLNEKIIFDYCRQHNLLSCVYLVELLKGTVTAKALDKAMVDSVISDVFTYYKKGPILFFQTLITSNKDCFKELCNVAYGHVKLKAMVLNKLIKPPQDLQQLGSYLDGFCTAIENKIISSIPLKKLPECIALKATNSNVREYLARYYSAEDVKVNDNIKHFCVENNAKESLFYIQLLEGEATEINLPPAQVISLVKDVNRLAGCTDYCAKLLASNLLIYKDMFNILITDNELKAPTLNQIISLIPKEMNEITLFINGFSAEIVYYLIEQASLSYLPAFLDYDINEKRLCHYLVECSEQVDIAVLNAYIDKHHYCHAGLLLSVIGLWREGKVFSVDVFVDQIKEYQKALFTKHSRNRSKIDPYILSICPVHNHKYIRKQTCCEGHLYYSKPKEQWAVKCRTNTCDVISNEQFSNALFYRLIGKLCNFTAGQLHQKEKFTRSIAALNRWNTILERLHCGDCNKPLSFSEHAKNSMGNMAIGATYWHCASKQCKQYCHSIKLSYCLGCNKVIDSRIDTQSCKPFEIKSFKKFYICNSCSSCCREHNGFSGRCGHCGKSNAYANDGKGNYSPQVTCKFCDKRVSINYSSFKQLTQLNSVLMEGNNNSCKLYYSASLHGGRTNELSESVLPWSGRTLYVYDLFSNLQNKNITFSMLSNFEQVYDVKILERIVDLGFYHKNYELTHPTDASFIGIFNSIIDDQSALNAQVKFQQKINYLFNTMNEQNLWAHYEQVEMPFLYALNDLLGDGIKIDNNEVTRLLKRSEVSRNILVEGLRNKGVEKPDNATFKTYIQRVYPEQYTPNLMKAIEVSDYKMFTEVSEEFSAMHKISKLERMGSLFKQVGHFQGAFIPDYQVIGAETGRCTSKYPNLLGFPKELRTLVKSRPGYGIVECDYSQMEIGVMAAMADDEVMIADYNSGDVYQTLANALGLSRDRAKLVFLSILYGVGITTLTSWLQLNIAQTKQLVEQFFQRYHQVKRLQDSFVAQGNNAGYVQAVSGLRRRVNFNAVQGANYQKKQLLEHWQNNWFKNFPIQASAAIVFKKAIITLAENNRGGLKLIAPMYDAIVFEAPLAELEQHTQVVESAMIRAMLERFSKLKPHIKVNNFDVTCWNAGKGSKDYDAFFAEIVGD